MKFLKCVCVCVVFRHPGYNGTLVGPKMPQEFSVNAAAHIWGPFAISIVAFMQFGGQAAAIVPAMLFYSFWSMYRLVGSQVCVLFGLFV